MDTHDNNTTKEYDFASRLSHKIISEHITPRSKFMTILIQALLWIPWLFVTLIGIVGVAGIIFTVAFSGWKYHGAIGIPPFLYAMQTVSVVWIMCLVLFGAIVIKAFRITQKGYRVSPFTIITLSLVVSIAGGSLIYIGDKILMQNNYFRKPIQARQHQLWNSPYKGRMVGMLSQANGTYFVSDEQEKLWQLSFENREEIAYIEGEAVRVVGIPIDEDTFKVCALFPLPLGVPPRAGQGRVISMPTEEEKTRVFAAAKEFNCDDIVVRKSMPQGERNQRARP
jgi:hypothetical protein